jgi:hypothetical protein
MTAAMGKKHKWMAKLRANSEAYERYKQMDRIRCRLYRASMSIDERKKYNEKTKLTMRKMCERKANESKKVKTRKSAEKERECWRLKKQEQRAKMSGQAKMRELEKDETNIKKEKIFSNVK